MSIEGCICVSRATRPGAQAGSRRPPVPTIRSGSVLGDDGQRYASASMRLEEKKRLMADLLHIAEETRQFKPPYIPSRYLQDLANSDPAELVYKYVLAKDATDGFERLWRERRLDLAVENVAWKNRDLFPPRVSQAAAARLLACDFDVKTQRHK